MRRWLVFTCLTLFMVHSGQQKNESPVTDNYSTRMISSAPKKKVYFTEDYDVVESTWTDQDGTVHTVKKVKRKETWEESEEGGDDQSEDDADFTDEGDEIDFSTMSPLAAPVPSITTTAVNRYYKRDGPTLLEVLLPMLGIEMPFKIYLTEIFEFWERSPSTNQLLNCAMTQVLELYDKICPYSDQKKPGKGFTSFKRYLRYALGAVDCFYIKMDEAIALAKDPLEVYETMRDVLLNSSLMKEQQKLAANNTYEMCMSIKLPTSIGRCPYTSLNKKTNDEQSINSSVSTTTTRPTNTDVTTRPLAKNRPETPFAIAVKDAQALVCLIFAFVINNACGLGY